MPELPPPREESVLDMVLGVLALLWWTVIVIEGLGVTLIVGLTDIEPRTAALMVLPLALIAWALLSATKSIRKRVFFF
ncbi:MAG: hypothetical protein ABL932_13930 [Terricaulis sp.]